MAGQSSIITVGDPTLNRLQRGHVIVLFGADHVVTMSNDSRARCVPLVRRAVSYTTAGGAQVNFSASGTSHSISPNSLVDIVRRLSEAELADLNIQETKTITTSGGT